MLIAVMSESHNRVTTQAELVALHGRAKLILEYETEELARHARMARRKASRAWLKDKLGGIDALQLLDEMQEHDFERMQQLCPRWLHVLMPGDAQYTEQGDEFILSTTFATIGSSTPSQLELGGHHKDKKREQEDKRREQ